MPLPRDFVCPKCGKLLEIQHDRRGPISSWRYVASCIECGWDSPLVWIWCDECNRTTFAIRAQWRVAINNISKWATGGRFWGHPGPTDYTHIPKVGHGYGHTYVIHQPGTSLPEPNAGNYTIKFQVSVERGYAYFRNINIIITVADGMVPNEYYKVELPSIYAPVGGIIIPVNELYSLAPWIVLASVASLVAKVVLKRMKRKQ